MRGVLLATFAVTLSLQAAASAQPAAPAADASRGRMLYNSIGCSQCHGYVGQGGSAGPRLAGKSLPIEYFSHQLRHPIEEMPPYTKRVLSDADVANIIAYVNSMK